MKKIYALLVVGFFLTATATAQTYYWIGPSSGAGGNWDDNNNWSLTSGGVALPAGQFPNGAGHNVIFDQNALVKVNLSNIDLSTLTVSNSATAKLFIGSPTASAVSINLLGTSAVNTALRINTGSRLEDSCDVNQPFNVAFGVDSKAVIDGVWYFAGRSTVLGANGATFTVPGLSGLSNRIDVNGTIQFRNNTVSPNPLTGEEYLFFNTGSTFWSDKNGGNVPRATWANSANILVSSVTGTMPLINVGLAGEIGNLVVNCAGMTVPTITWSLPDNLVIKGNLQVQNTNNRILVLATNGSSTNNDIYYNIRGNFNISGTSRVALASATATTKVFTFELDGNLNVGGTSFDLQISNLVSSNSTTLKVKGNISHTAGTFGSSGNAVSTTTDLYIIELNGTVNQNISSTGTIDNAANEITLLMNNPAGATLTSPLAIGKLSFNSANKGKINTSNVNILTVNNTGTHALVVNAPSSTGFVNGPVRRRTSVITDYALPTGKASTYDPITVRPSTSTLSVYQGEYFNTTYSDLSVQSPLNGVSNQEYWSFSTISGADAAITLTLSGAVPGAVASDGIVVSHYNGVDWTDYSFGGVIITPGTATSGSPRSLVTTQNGLYTFGFGLAGALPIRLVNFDARKISSASAQVNWLISASSNAERFEVLRSADGRNFSGIGTVTAIDRQYSYSYTDNSLPAGTSYYRLKMTDKEGVVSYSPVVAVLNGTKGVFITSMIPTIVRGSASLNVTSSERGTMQLVITDMYGRMIKQQRAAIGTGNQLIALDLQSLPAGAYQVTGYMNNTQVGTIRFVRQ